MKKPAVACLILVCSLLATPSQAQLSNLDQGFEEVLNLNPPAEDGTILATQWLGALRSSPSGFTGVFQGVPPDGMGVGGGFLAHAGPDNSYMGVSFTNAGTFTVNDVISTWMISPVLNLENGNVISFYTRTVDMSLFPDRLDIRLSTNGASANVGSNAFTVGDFTTSLMTINPGLMVGGYPQEWTQFNVEIEGLAEATEGRFALHYFIEDLSINAEAIGIDTLTYGIPSPECVLGDVNMDGGVTLLDVNPFVQIIVSGDFLCEADINQDQVVDLLDVSPFVDILLSP